MQLNLIFASAANGVVGKDGALPWHLPEDLARFKRLTLGYPVIMGRKTWESLPPRFRPLPGRLNIVLTRQSGWTAEGAITVGDCDEALARCDGAEQVWVIGGAQIWALAEPLADRAEVTLIDQDFEGDAFAPKLDSSWVESGRSHQLSANGLPFSFISYTRKPSLTG